MSNNLKVILCASYEDAVNYAKTHDVKATVEAEYGAECVPGSVITMAHHGTRSSNPAPCNWSDVPVLTDGEILVSHLDLDSMGGIMALMGMKPDNPEFWKAAEFIDLNGPKPKNMNQLSQDIQDKLNAFYNYTDNAVPDLRRSSGAVDITNLVLDTADAISDIVNEDRPRHNEMIEAGIKWKQDIYDKVEKCIYLDSPNVRVFSTKNLFCNVNYESSVFNRVSPAIVSYNSTRKDITLSFYDENAIGLNACEIVQAAWGPLAGGHAGIAGSPRGQEMGLGDAIELANYVDELIQARILNDAGSGIETPETDGIEIEEYDEDFDDFEDR